MSIFEPGHIRSEESFSDKNFSQDSRLRHFADSIFGREWNFELNAELLLEHSKALLGLPYVRLQEGDAPVVTESGFVAPNGIDCFTTTLILLEALKLQESGFDDLLVPEVWDFEATIREAIRSEHLLPLTELDEPLEAGLLFKLRTERGLYERGHRHLMFFVSPEIFERWSGAPTGGELDSGGEKSGGLVLIHAKPRKGFVHEVLSADKLEKRLSRGTWFRTAR